jgi:hypothetical protein
MDVTQHSEIATPLKGTGKGACVLKVRQSNIAVALEAKMKEVEILRYDRVCRPREVKREGIFHGTKVMQLKNEVFREIFR